MVRDFSDANTRHQPTKLLESRTEPIPNLTEFLEERGIKVLRLPFSDNVDGVMCQARKEMVLQFRW